nr:unnamed protein product [Callosobruchus chinensis]
MLVLVTIVSVNNGFIGFLLLVVGLSSVLARLQEARRPPIAAAAPAVAPYYNPAPYYNHVVPVALRRHYRQEWDRSDVGTEDSTTATNYGQQHTSTKCNAALKIQNVPPPIMLWVRTPPLLDLFLNMLISINMMAIFPISALFSIMNFRDINIIGIIPVEIIKGIIIMGRILSMMPFCCWPPLLPLLLPPRLRLSTPLPEAYHCSTSPVLSRAQDFKPLGLRSA